MNVAGFRGIGFRGLASACRALGGGGISEQLEMPNRCQDLQEVQLFASALVGGGKRGRDLSCLPGQGADKPLT